MCLELIAFIIAVILFAIMGCYLPYAGQYIDWKYFKNTLSYVVDSYFSPIIGTIWLCANVFIIMVFHNDITLWVSDYHITNMLEALAVFNVGVISNIISDTYSIYFYNTINPYGQQIR